MDFIFIDVKDTFSLGDKMQNKIVTDARSEFVVLGAIFVAVKSRARSMVSVWYSEKTNIGKPPT